MDYQVSILSGVNFAPATVAAEVLQNVRCILSTHVGTVPLDRDFGVSWDALDSPVNIAKVMLRAEVFDAIERFEPRAKVTSVDWKEDTDSAMDGTLIPVVTLQIDDSLTTAAASTVSTTSSGTVTTSTDANVGTMQETILSLAQQQADMEARLHELESTDYKTIYQTGDEE